MQPEAFLDLVAERVQVTESGCWEWTGARMARGYGELRVGGDVVYAHRTAYEALVGPIPEGLTLDHLCRNRACVSPHHLEVVSMHENWKRGESLTAINARKTHCKRGHLLQGRNLIQTTQGKRQCRTCVRANDRAAYAKRKARA